MFVSRENTGSAVGLRHTQHGGTPHGVSRAADEVAALASGAVSTPPRYRWGAPEPNKQQRSRVAWEVGQGIACTWISRRTQPVDEAFTFTHHGEIGFRAGRSIDLSVGW